MERKKLVATVAFVVVVGGVLGTFTYLGSQDPAPAMPEGPHHQLRLNLNGELIGVEADPPVDPVAASGGEGFVYDKKAVEKRVNEGCRACHTTLPPHHPPKQECIKCHRMQPRAPSPASAPPAP